MIISYAWSPDSKWLAYAMDNSAGITTVSVYSTEQAKSFQVSDGMSDVSDPVFDRSGKYLYFFASTDAGPVKDWFAQSNADMRASSGIYLAVLPNDIPSPLAKESDEEKPVDPKAAAEKPAGGQAGRRQAGRRRRRSVRSGSTSKGSSTGSWICRFRPERCRTFRPAPPGTSTTCARPTERPRSIATT